MLPSWPGGLVHGRKLANKGEGECKYNYDREGTMKTKKVGNEHSAQKLSAERRSRDVHTSRSVPVLQTTVPERNLREREWRTKKRRGERGAKRF